MPSARSGGEVRVRLRLSVKRVDQRRWAGEANGDGGAAAAKALAAGKVRGSRVCSLGSRVALDPKAPVSARLRTVSGGRVKLLCCTAAAALFAAAPAEAISRGRPPP